MTGQGFALRIAVALLLIALGGALGAPPAAANSVFGVGGLGEPSLEENATLRALGGAGAAEHGASRFSLVNPASIAEAQHLVLEANFLSTRRSIATLHFGSESAYETSFPSVRMVVRLPAKLILGGSYLLGTSGDFTVDRAESAGAASTLHIEGTGGINYARGTLARQIHRHVLAGVDYEVIGGSFREEWSRKFSDPNLSASRDTLEVGWARLGRWRFGAVYAGAGVSFGAAYETGRRLPLTERQRTAGADERIEGRSLTIPSGLAAGFNASLGSRNRVVGQYRRRSWDRESLASTTVDFRSEERYSIGVERGAATFGSTLQRIPIRIGATLLRWPDLLPVSGASDISGGVAGVDEWAASIGTGLLTRDRGGSIDVSLEGGRRGSESDLGARETFFRAGISLRVSDETWK